MDMWTLDIDYREDNEHEISIWDSEDEAWRQAASEVQSRIFGYWDMNDQDAAKEAEEINELVRLGKFQDAVIEWNDCPHNQYDERALFVWVNKTTIKSVGKTPRIMGKTFFTALNEDEDVEEAEVVPVVDVNKPYLATEPGATCRSSNCNYHSEYAYADKPDGTFVCASCRMMKAVFAV